MRQIERGAFLHENGHGNLLRSPNEVAGHGVQFLKLH
jgi:hypothetical protein